MQQFAPFLLMRSSHWELVKLIVGNSFKVHLESKLGLPMRRTFRTELLFLKRPFVWTSNFEHKSSVKQLLLFGSFFFFSTFICQFESFETMKPLRIWTGIVLGTICLITCVHSPKQCPKNEVNGRGKPGKEGRKKGSCTAHDYNHDEYHKNLQLFTFWNERKQISDLFQYLPEKQNHDDH